MTIQTAATALIKRSLLVLPLAMTPIFIGKALDAMAIENSLGKVAAQEEGQKKKYKARRTPALRESVFKQLGKAQAIISPDEKEGEKVEPNFTEGLRVLRDLEANKASTWNPYELSQLYNYFGFVYYSLENYRQAIKYYKLVVAQSPNIPMNTEVATLYTIAQMHFVLEEYGQAITVLKKWMELSPIVGADAYVLLAQAHYQNGDQKKALPLVDKAVKIYEDKGKVPRENWYSLQRALYFERNDFKKVIEILRKLVRHYPKWSYWRQLSGLYGQQEDTVKQLHTAEPIYIAGGYSKEKELLNVAYLLMAEDAPYKAAKIIDKGMKDGIIEKTSKNHETLATAWRLSQEMKKAIPQMEQAAKKSKKGDLYASLAGVYLDGDKYKEALDAAEKARKRGDLKRPDQLYIVEGMANANLKKYDACAEAMGKAEEDKRSRKFAGQWKQFCQNEKDREEKLAQN